jgi:hypothetical protein
MWELCKTPSALVLPLPVLQEKTRAKEIVEVKKKKKRRNRILKSILIGPLVYDAGVSASPRYVLAGVVST